MKINDKVKDLNTNNIYTIKNILTLNTRTFLEFKETEIILEKENVELIENYEECFQLNSIENVYNGKYLHFYNLNYKNKIGDDKIYEIVSRKPINKNNLGKHNDAVVIVVKHKTLNKYLLLKEFRPAINNYVFNLVAGLIDDGEDEVSTIIRELKEETGLIITKDNIKRISPSTYTAIGLSDEQVSMAYVEVDSDIDLQGDTNPNELMFPQFYSLDEIKEILKYENITTRLQLVFNEEIFKQEKKEIVKTLKDKYFEKAKKSESISDRKCNLSMVTAMNICLEVLDGIVTLESAKNGPKLWEEKKIE